MTHWSNFEDWDPYQHYVVAKTYCGYEDKSERNVGTYTNFAQSDTCNGSPLLLNVFKIWIWKDNPRCWYRH